MSLSAPRALRPALRRRGAPGAALAAVFAACLFAAGCMTPHVPRDPLAVHHGDRCAIDDAEFVVADQLYSRYGSIAMVEEQLRKQLQWRDCQVNEAIYRLRKVHNLP